MLNIVMPMAGKSQFFDDQTFRFPKPLIEIEDRPMIELVLASLLKIKGEKRFIFIVSEEDATRYHLGDVIKLLTDDTSIIVRQNGDTKGAVCSVLLGIEHFNSSDPLLIVNSDSVIDHSLNLAMDTFAEKNADAGTICFNSVHPQWSYVLTDSENIVIEAAEKHPISTHAIAGFYYFRKGSEFVKAAFGCITKEAKVNDRYFTSLTFNELILDGKKVVMYPISNSEYHSFYSPEKIKLYENRKVDSGNRRHV